MSDNAEDRRLLGIYGQLREKLLDLSKRNRMLNYEIGAKNKRQVRFVGADLQGLYDVFISPRARVAVVPLPEPDSIPPDERTPEFLVALNHTRDNDVEYQIGLEGLSSTAADSDQALDALGSVGIQDSHGSAFVIQAVDGQICFDGRPMGEDGASLPRQARRPRPQRDRQ